MSKPFSVKLSARGLIRLDGADAIPFLQGLVSNDVSKADANTIVYACLLTPQGKFLHDFFIHRTPDGLLLDCEGGDRARDLYDRLTKFRLRAKVSLSVEDNADIYAVVGTEHGLPDPRHPALGYRSFEKPAVEEGSFADWDALRISLLVPDGSRDMELEKSTLLECGIEKLNGIDWKKGCYMGQELTARMHYRGLAKKHLCLVDIDGAAPPPFSDLQNGGQMRSSCGAVGLALLKDDGLFSTDYAPVKPRKTDL
ncbi:MAG: folate-binding protein [Micavibrio aeruginosavorus]|uniref:Folate-binding protein n=1 Tax=Micavibrio aeruginosavorus TaxID=349221 RepID=A0A2W4ZVT6_9BACT|nr:MAG: folate-binding protein [Micavibrio aeruginosavorus]